MHLNKDSNPYYFNLPQKNKYFVDREYEESMKQTNDNPNDDNKKNKTKGILTLIGGILIYLSLGSIYTIGTCIFYLFLSNISHIIILYKQVI